MPVSWDLRCPVVPPPTSGGKNERQPARCRGRQAVEEEEEEEEGLYLRIWRRESANTESIRSA